MFDERKRIRRDLRVDFFRGLALITIFVDHVPHNRWAAITQQNFGFSDAAELFVALAGFSAVLAYGRYFDTLSIDGVRKIASRIGSIYVYHIATLLIVAAILLVISRVAGDATLLGLMKFEPLLSGDVTAVVGAALLVIQPTFFDILPLYVVLLAIFPLLYALLSRSIPLGLASSALPWLLVQFVPLNLPTATGEGWHFNPLAWQFLMALGMAAAIKSRRQELQPSRVLIALALLILIVSVFLRAPWTRWPLYLDWVPIALKPYGALMVKTTLGPARLLHFIAFGYLLLAVIPPRAAWLKTRLARTFSDAGRNSLEVFCLGVVLSVIGGALVIAAGHDAVVESWVTTAGAATLLLLGVGLAREMRARKQARQRRLRSSPAAAVDGVEGLASPFRRAIRRADADV
jgi:hypothetical protein